MNGFVDDCRREWKRLGVDDQVANDMAAELEADLAEGASAEDVLASDASDARSFAHAWAVQRGVVRTRRRSRLPAVLATLALVPTIAGAVLTIHDSSSPRPSSTPFALPRSPSAARIAAAPPGTAVWIASDRTVLVDVNASDKNDSNTLGIVLLIVGLAVLVPLTVYSSARVALDG